MAQAPAHARHDPSAPHLATLDPNLDPGVTHPAGLAAPPAPAKSHRTRLEPQSAEWRARCVELATEHGLVGLAMPLPVRVPVSHSTGYAQNYLVPSQSDHGTCHRVARLLYGGISCDCVAATYGQPCGHAGAVIAHAEAMARTLDPRESQVSGDYWRWWMQATGQLTDASSDEEARS